jgi:hypothetical protein
MPEGREAPNGTVSGKRRDDASAATLDFAIESPEPAEDDEVPPAIVDNLARIRSDYEKSFADYQAVRTEALNTLTTASFFGGMGLALLVAMLGLMRIVSGIHLWAAAIGATTCSLIIGAILMDPGRLAAIPNVATEFASHHAAMSKPTECEGPAKTIDKPDAVADFGKTLLWEPLLIADRDGKASIHFTFPDAPGTFHVIVDAHDAGRLGSCRAKIITGESLAPGS